MTYPIGDGAHHRRGQYQAARPPKQTPARDTLPTTPPPGPAWTRSAKVAATRELIAEINKAADQRNALLASLFPILRDAQHLEPSTAQVDPASFRHQLEQARAAIRELLEFIDTKDALIRDLCETVIWLDSDECNDAREWPAFVQRCRDILTSGYQVPT